MRAVAGPPSHAKAVARAGASRYFLRNGRGRTLRRAGRRRLRRLLSRSGRAATSSARFRRGSLGGSASRWPASPPVLPAASAGSAAGAGASVTSSNCSRIAPTDRRTPLTASNGTSSRSGMPPNDRPTSKASSPTVEIPELVLQHDGHFLRILRAHALATAARLGTWCRR